MATLRVAASLLRIAEQTLEALSGGGEGKARHQSRPSFTPYWTTFELKPERVQIP